MSDLDISWVQETTRMCSLEQNLLREKSPSIKARYVYINLNNEIIDVIDENIVLHDSDIITKERCLQLVQSRTKKDKIKYILKDIGLFHVSLKPEQIPLYNSGKTRELELKTFPILDDIVIPPSIFIFHHLNSLYFFFYESPNSKMGVKSILKPNSTNGNGIKKTKKVRISLPSSSEKIAFRKTRKYIHFDNDEKDEL